MTNFKKGDKVKFTHANRVGYYMHDYSTSDAKLTKHGYSTIGHKYFVNFGIVKGISGSDIYVEFDDNNGGRTCLGFKEKYLELISTKITNWKVEVLK